MAHLELTAIYQPVENGWIQARVAELPGVITAAPTVADARHMLADALAEYLASFSAETLPDTPDTPGTQREPLTVNIG